MPNNQAPFDCLGCAIVLGRVVPPGGLLGESEHFVVHQDPDVPVRGFLIVASKRHIRSIAEMGAAEAAELFALVHRLRLAQAQAAHIREVRLIQEERSGHFHLWLLPWEAWMEARFANTLASVREMMRFAKENRSTDEHLQEVLRAAEAIKTCLNTQPAAE